MTEITLLHVALLAAEDPETIREYQRLGLMERGAASEGFTLADVGRTRLIRRLIEAGQSLETIAAAADGDGFPADFLGRLGPPPGDAATAEPDPPGSERGESRGGGVTVQAAIAFADLASFTPLTVVHGDHEAAQILERYGSAVRQTAARWQGTIVKQIGDAFMLAFADPDAAVRWALALRSRIRSEPRFPALHVGIQFGNVRRRDGDYIGSTVNLAARLADAAERHQVMVSQDLVDRVEERDGLAFKLVDTRRLKGFDTPVTLYEAVSHVDAPDTRPVDEVCGMALSPDDVVARLMVDGDEHVFCSADCLRRFVDRSADTTP